jgi:hypothetical protein
MVASQVHPAGHELPAHTGAIRPGKAARHIGQRRQEREPGGPIAQNGTSVSFGLFADAQPMSRSVSCEVLDQLWRDIVRMEIER